jgi:alpha-glucoside transport system substrate-binding protein
VRGTRKFKKTAAVSAAVLLASAGLAACGGGDGGSSSSKTVTIWLSLDQPVIDGFKAELDPKAKAAGITVKWQKVANINQLIMTKIQAKDTPDIAFIPQPGVVKDIVKRNAGKPLDSVLDMTALKSNMLPGTLEAGTIDGKLYGYLASINVKSLVFYNKKAWDKAGYKAPDSIDALNALTDQIKSDGGTPWCMGIQDSGGATGWPATDWFEDLVMRYGGADEYNGWVDHTVKFDSPLVRQAAAEFEKLLFTKGNVPGDQKAIASTAWTTAANAMFDAKPGCWLLKQGSFYTAFFPKPVQADLDNSVGVFGFPPATAGGDNPTLGGGDMAVLFNDGASAKKVMNLLAETALGTQAAKNSSFISPHSDFDTSLYGGALHKAMAEIASKTTQFLFDASDQMPGAVGAGAFWKDITAWVAGQESLDDALKNIDAAWPTS